MLLDFSAGTLVQGLREEETHSPWALLGSPLGPLSLLVHRNSEASEASGANE